jgi:hypothetical protein
MRKRPEVLLLAVTLVLGCGAFGILTREEKEALSYLRFHPVDLSPERLTYPYLRDSLRCAPGEHPVFYGVSNAYQAYWFGRVVQATFAGSDEPGLGDRPVWFVIQKYSDEPKFPVSLAGIHIGDSMEASLRLFGKLPPDRVGTSCILISMG